MRSQKPFPLHTFLFAAYPTIALLAFNIEEVRILDTARILLLSIISATILFLLVYWRIRDKEKTALVTSLVLVLFFSYGHMYVILKKVSLFGFIIGRHRFQLILWVVIFIAGIWRITRRLNDPKILTITLNIVMLTASALPVYQISSTQLRQYDSQISVQRDSNEEWSLGLPEDSKPPDIYYIVLDGYPRADVLSEFYGYDASSFIEDLENLGFVVASESLSNYAQTTLSIASSLNMNYLEALGDGVNPQSESRTWLVPLIQHSKVRQAFEFLEYQTVSYESGYSHTDIQDTDLYITSDTASLSGMVASSSINPFEAMLLRSTMMRAWIDLNFVLPRTMQGIIRDPLRLHRQRILTALDGLEQMAEMPGPKFVFVHLLFPHPPFVMGPNGEPLGQIDEYTLAAGAAELEEGTYHDKYLDQVLYLNTRLIPIMQALIENSETEPIIVLQSDHGGLHTTDIDQMRIFNAYLLPGDGDANLYSTITPVNSFRLIFNTYFQGSYGILEDHSYYSPFSEPYNLTPIEDK